MVLLQRLNKLPVGSCLYLCFCSCKQCCFITKEIAEWLLFNYLNIFDLINILQIDTLKLYIVFRQLNFDWILINN